MSGFDVNVLSTKPVIREAASMNNDGGAGNLGYMARDDSEDEKKRRQDESIFSKKEEGDIFTYQKDIKIPDENEDFSFLKFLTEVIYSIKHLFIKK